MTAHAISYGQFRTQARLLKADLSTRTKTTYTALACCAGGKDHAWPNQKSTWLKKCQYRRTRSSAI